MHRELERIRVHAIRAGSLHTSWEATMPTAMKHKCLLNFFTLMLVECIIASVCVCLSACLSVFDKMLNLVVT